MIPFGSRIEWKFKGTLGTLPVRSIIPHITTIAQATRNNKFTVGIIIILSGMFNFGSIFFNVIVGGCTVNNQVVIIVCQYSFIQIRYTCFKYRLITINGTT